MFVGVREPRAGQAPGWPWATGGHCLAAKAALLWWWGTLQPVTLTACKPAPYPQGECE